MGAPISPLDCLDGGVRMEGHAQCARALQELGHELWVEGLEWALAPVQDDDLGVGPRRDVSELEGDGGARRLGCGLYDLDLAPRKPPASGLG